MDVQKVIDKINEKPYLMRMGATKIANQLKVSPDLVREAKKRLHKEIKVVPPTKKVPKILLIDIETAPLLAAVFQKQIWKARISHENMISDWFILTFSCKWLGEDDVISDGLTPKEALDEDDNRLVRKLWYILSDADIVIAHNGDDFDVPNINARFVVHGLGPTTSYKQIDTLRIAQKFGFTHKNLNALAHVFGIESKIETTFELWKKCIKGDAEALLEMERYNRHDVEILEEVYLRLRPWVKSHVNVSLYSDDLEKTCPHCGSTEITLIPDKYYYTQTGKYPLFRCLNCGATPRDRKSVLDKSKNLLISIPGR